MKIRIPAIIGLFVILILTQCKSADEDPQVNIGYEDQLASLLFLSQKTGQIYSGTALIDTCDGTPLLTTCQIENELEDQLFNLVQVNTTLNFNINGTSLSGELFLYMPHSSGSLKKYRFLISATVEFTLEGKTLIHITPISGLIPDDNSTALIDITEAHIEMDGNRLTGILKLYDYSTDNDTNSTMRYSIAYEKLL